MVGVFLIFERFYVGHVYVGAHGIANGVLSRDTTFRQAGDQEVVSQVAIVCEMGLEIDDTLIVILTILKDYQLRGAIYLLGEILANTTSRRSHLCCIQVSSNRELLNDSVCVGWMRMALSRWASSVIAFERVASIVVFAYVAANVVLNEETASRMLTYEFIYVKDEIIEKDKLLAIVDAAVELLPWHRYIMWVEILSFALLYLIFHFKEYEHNEEKWRLGYGKDLSNLFIVFLNFVEVHDSRVYRDLRAYQDSKAEVLVSSSNDANPLCLPFPLHVSPW